MKTLIILSCLCAMVYSIPVFKKVFKVPENVPSLIEVEATDPVTAVRKARQLFDLDIDIYNNNGNGYFDNGDDFGGGYGGYGGGYGGYGGGYGGYGGGYGGYGGGYGGYGGGCSICG